MAKYYRRYSKKGSVSRRQFNKIASTYMKYKVAVNFQATWSGVSSPYIIFGGQGQVMTADSIFGNTGNEYLTLRGYYSFYKLTGVLMEVIPTRALGPNGEFGAGGTAVLGLVQSGETLNYNTLAQSPQALALDINNKSRKYVPLKGSWVATNLIANNAMKLCIAANGGIASGSVNFNIRLVLYLTFKNPI